MAITTIKTRIQAVAGNVRYKIEGGKDLKY